MHETRVISPKQLWRYGLDEEDEPFGIFVEVLIDGDGRSYLLDSQLNQIVVLAADGECLRTIGSEGEGPGEFRSPIAMFLMPGNRVAVVQASPSRIVVFDQRGDSEADFPVPTVDGFAANLGAKRSGDTFVTGRFGTNFQPRSANLRSR